MRVAISAFSMRADLQVMKRNRRRPLDVDGAASAVPSIEAAN
jgi:hypothetical protein